MKINRLSPELKVGIVVLIGFIILFYMSFKISKFGILSEKGYELQVYLENANGIDPKSPVLIAGVEIGRVKKVKLDNFKALVTLIIKEGSPDTFRQHHSH